MNDQDFAEPEVELLHLDAQLRQLAYDSRVEPNNRNVGRHKLFEMVRHELLRWRGSGKHAPARVSHTSQLVLCHDCKGRGLAVQVYRDDEVRTCGTCAGQGRLLQHTVLERLQTLPEGRSPLDGWVGPQPPAPQGIGPYDRLPKYPETQP